MSRRKKTSVRWVLPGIILVLVCAGITPLLLKRYSPNRQQPATALRDEANLKSLPWPATNRPLISLAVTNQPKAEDPEDRVVALVAEGVQLLAQGRPAEAARKYEQAVDISPDQEDLHYNLAIALAKMGRTEDAKKQYAEALRIFPEYAEAHNNLGNLLMGENKLDEAINRFQEALKNMPNNASFRNNLGTALARQGRTVEAMGEFREAIKQSPTYVEARVNLANTFLATGRVKEAIAQLNEALRLKPDFKPALQAMQRARQQPASGK